MNGGLGTVLAVCVGAILSLSVQIFMEALRDSRLKKHLSHAIAGEISSVLQIVEKRKYLDAVRDQIAIAERGERCLLKIRIHGNYFAVIEANLQNVGVLPVQLPIMVPKFLNFAKAAMDDFAALLNGEFDALQPPDLALLYAGLLELLESATATGREIIMIVATLYGSPHSRYPIGHRFKNLFRVARR